MRVESTVFFCQNCELFAFRGVYTVGYAVTVWILHWDFGAVFFFISSQDFGTSDGVVQNLLFYNRNILIIDIANNQRKGKAYLQMAKNFGNFIFDVKDGVEHRYNLSCSIGNGLNFLQRFHSQDGQISQAVLRPQLTTFSVQPRNFFHCFQR